MPANVAITRRAALGRMAALAGGLAVGCTPLRYVLRAYPADFEADRELTDRVLRAFVDAVVPGIRLDAPDLARAFFDEDYPFAKYAAFFAAHLCRRGDELFGVGRFDALDRERRTAVVRAGLRGDAAARKLYEGAIFLAQVSVYAGIYDDERGCPLIDFPGRYRVRPHDQLTYPDPARFLAAESTADGNHA